MGERVLQSPGSGEDLVSSARARLREEIGINCQLVDVGTVTYRAECGSSGLVEHELDHVLIGVTDDEPVLDVDEVVAVAWADPEAVLRSPPPGAAPWLVPVLRVAEAARKASSTSA